MSYSEKFEDPRWQKRRLEIFNRDNFECIECGDGKETLHVHHLYYVKSRDPWNYPDFALVTLCKTCHDATHVRVASEFMKWERLMERLSEGNLMTLNVLLKEIDDAIGRGVININRRAIHCFMAAGREGEQ